MSPKRIVQIAAILLTSSLTFTTCDDGPTGRGGVVTDTSLFPNAIGMLWKYEVYDSLTQNTDTVWVSVTDSGQYALAPTDLKWRTYWSSAGTVTDLYAVVRGDTIDFLIDTTFIPKNLERFVLPLSLGAQWVGLYFADTSRVTDIATVVVPAGSFDSSALIERSWNLDFEGGGSHSETWVTPRVGIVRRYLHSRFSDGTQFHVTVNQTWELIFYDLTTFALNEFPNSIGTEWVYQVVDTTTGLNNPPIVTYDTVTVTVDSKIPISWADSAMLWQFIGAATDTFIVAVTGDRVQIAKDTLLGPFSTYWYYQFPLAVGREWGIITILPVPMINRKESISTPAGDFPTAFHYYFHESRPLSYNWTVDHWLVPGVGIAQRKFTRVGIIDSLTQHWTLLSYK